MIQLEWSGLTSFILCTIFTLSILLLGYNLIGIILPNISNSNKKLYALPTAYFMIYILFVLNTLLNGIIFSNNLIITSFTLIITIILYSSHKKRPFFDDIKSSNYIRLIILAISLCFYCLSIMVTKNGIIMLRGDMKYHMGFINQILNGSIPRSMYQGIPNTYPWLFHAIGAYYANIFMSLGFTQIRSIFLAYNTLGINTIILGFFAITKLGNVFFRNSIKNQNIYTYLCMFSGGFGFIIEKTNIIQKIETSDVLINHPYISSPIFIIPSWPRHLSYAVFLFTIYLVTHFQKKANNKNAIVLGITLGIGALIQSVPYIIVTTILVIFFIQDLFKRKINRHIIIAVFVSGIMIIPWGIRFLLTALKYGITPTTGRPPIDLSFYELLLTYGMIGIFIIYGLFLEIREKEKMVEKNNSIKNFLAFYLFVIIICNFNSMFSWNVSFFQLLIFRQHRYWNQFYIFLAVFATIGMEKASSIIAIKIKRREIRIILTLLIIGLLSGSPIYTSIVKAEKYQKTEVSQNYKEYNENDLMQVLNEKTKKSITVSTPLTPKDLALDIFCFTGFNLMYKKGSNIKTKNIDIPSQEERLNDTIKLYGKTSYIEKKSIVEKYDIDYIITNTKKLRHGNRLFSETQEVTYLGKIYYLNTVIR